MDNFINDLFDILKINTIYNTDKLPFGSGNIKCLNHMLDLGKSHGFKSKNLDNYCGYIEYGSGKEMLGILCHLDVVDVNIDKWDTNPFNPVIKNNKIYARGAMDDKGPLMASFYAIKELKEEGFIPNKRIRLIMGCNEESGSLCMAHYKKLEEEPTISFSPDAEYPVIFGEKGILTIKISGTINSIIKEIHAGVKFNIVPDKASVTLKDGFKKEYIGKAAHAMNPNLGINAINLLVDDIKTRYNDIFINFLDKYFINDTKASKIGAESFDKDMLELTSNLAILDVLDDKFSMVINYRLPKDSDYDIIINNITNILNEYNFKLEVLDYMKVHKVDPNSFLVQTLLNSYKKYTNDTNALPISIGGGTYAKSFTNSVAFGIKLPNEMDTCHIDNEYVSIDTLKLSIKIMKDAIKELCK